METNLSTLKNLFINQWMQDHHLAKNERINLLICTTCDCGVVMDAVDSHFRAKGHTVGVKVSEIMAQVPGASDLVKNLQDPGVADYSVDLKAYSVAPVEGIQVIDGYKSTVPGIVYYGKNLALVKRFLKDNNASATQPGDNTWESCRVQQVFLGNVKPYVGVLGRGTAMNLIINPEVNRALLELAAIPHPEPDPLQVGAFHETLGILDRLDSEFIILDLPTSDDEREFHWVAPLVHGTKSLLDAIFAALPNVQVGHLNSIMGTGG
jgi:Orsellinic acid/F9775 biosynthesis cluster protein D